jgi:hypothetical protein
MSKRWKSTRFSTQQKKLQEDEIRKEEEKTATSRAYDENLIIEHHKPFYNVVHQSLIAPWANNKYQSRETPGQAHNNHCNSHS